MKWQRITILVFLGLCVLSTPVAADEPVTVSSVEPSKAPWRGSSFTMRNSVSVPSLVPDTDLTYNPYYAMTFAFRAQGWFSDIFYMQSRFSITREITESDVTTTEGETWPSDVAIRFGASRFYTIPVLGTSFSGNLDITAPTSPVSQARTRLVGIAPALSVRQNFDVLSGISLGYGFRATYGVYRHTTAERQVPLIGGCAATASGCEEYLNTGLRNVEWRLSHSVDLSFAFTDWLSLSASGSFVTDYLHALGTDTTVSYIPQEPEDRRFLIATDVSLAFQPMPSLGITVGASTSYPQLAPDSSYRTPFFNRYTEIYLDLSLDVAGLVSQIHEASE